MTPPNQTERIDYSTIHVVTSIDHTSAAAAMEQHPIESSSLDAVDGESDSVPHSPLLTDTAESLLQDALVPSFLSSFLKSKGPPHIVVLCMLLALGFGSTIGVVPAVMTDRYARLNHGFDGAATDVSDGNHPTHNSTMTCADYTTALSAALSTLRSTVPQACLDGSADAQSAVALEQLVSNALTFFTSTLVGSLSDEHGRRVFLLSGVAINIFSRLILVLMQLSPTMSPAWYYSFSALSGLINWTAVALSALSDVMPAQWRAPSFGLLLAGFSLGFCMAPLLALRLGHFGVSCLSLATVLVGFLGAVIWLPETLPVETSCEAKRIRKEQREGLTRSETMWWMLHRPVRELSILNRSRLFRLLSCLAFFSGMGSSGDQTLLIYYIEERLGFNDGDIAKMFLIMGLFGIFLQGFMLKFVNDCIGERRVVMLAFTIGVIHNILYGFADKKATIFTGVALAAFVGMAFPTISAIKSNNVETSEQGRIQGALYSLSALASGVGPVAMRFVYRYTKDGALFGPGSMFLFAGALYSVATFCAYSLPPDANSKYSDTRNAVDDADAQRQVDIDSSTPLL